MGMDEKLNATLWNIIGWCIIGAIFGGLLITLKDIFAWTAPMWMNESAWTWTDSRGWIDHEKMATVYADTWANGEYKECGNVNTKADQSLIYLDCGNLSAAGKVFKVRFNARTHIDGQPFEATFNWTCLKRENDPAIVCERKAEAKSETPSP